MWLIWGLIILGGVWDAAYSITLRNAEYNKCVGLNGKEVHLKKCRAGSDGQTWLWEGKRLKNKKSGECMGVPREDHTNMVPCSFPGVGPEKLYNEFTEFTRVGEHGLKTSTGKCLKFLPHAMTLGNCTDDKDDPYYE
jgi:hypothetical protein